MVNGHVDVKLMNFSFAVSGEAAREANGGVKQVLEK